MELPTPEIIKHQHMMDEYVNMQVEYICRQTGQDRQLVTKLVQDVVRDKYQAKKITILKSPSYGNVVKVGIARLC